jgi:hypothetical protein
MCIYTAIFQRRRIFFSLKWIRLFLQRWRCNSWSWDWLLGDKIGRFSPIGRMFTLWFLITEVMAAFYTGKSSGLILKKWFCCCLDVVVSMLLSRCCCLDVVVSMLLFRCCCREVVVVMLLSRCCCRDVVVAMLLIHWYAATPTHKMWTKTDNVDFLTPSWHPQQGWVPKSRSEYLKPFSSMRTYVSC